MLCRLGEIRACVLDIPMEAHYGEEKSSLVVRKVIAPFFFRHSKRVIKRLLYNYFVRDFSAASISLLMGIGLSTFGIGFGLYQWVVHAARSELASTGTIMIAALSLIIGVQLLLSFFNYDIANVPQRPLHPSLSDQLSS